MITRLRQRLVYLPAILLAFEVTATNPALGGCYCMMENESVYASYNKTGFPDSTTNLPQPIYLQSTTVSTTKYHHAGDDGDGDTFLFDYSLLEVSIDQYDISAITNVYVYEPPDCRTYTLPQTTTDNTSEYLYYYATSDGELYFLSVLSDQTAQTNEGSSSCNGSWYSVDYYGDYDEGSACDGSWPYGESFSDEINSFYEGDVWTETDQSSANYWWVDYESDYSSSGGSYNDSIKEYNVLSQPFTDEMLRSQIIARMPDWPTGWSYGSGTAYYIFNDDKHWCASGGQMQYRVKVPQSLANTTYLLQWQEVTQYPGSTNTTSVTKKGTVQGTGDPVNPAVGQTYTVEMPTSPSTIYETAPEIIKVTGSGDPNNGTTPGSSVSQ